MRRRLGAACAFSLSLAIGAPAHGYDPATTHAGLTEKAAVAAGLHATLNHKLGRALGLLEPLTLTTGSLDADSFRSLQQRLAALDPAQGYQPAGIEGGDLKTSALSWLVAGAVLAQTPAERGRNHFFDPSSGRGLDDGPAGIGFFHAAKLALDGGAALRQVAAGTAFDLTGQAAPAWVASRRNDQGLPAFWQAREAASTQATPELRDAALVRTLLAAGGILAVLQDCGEPAHVRNDFRGAYGATAGLGPWDRVSGFERYVGDTRGRTGIPAPAATVERPTFASFFSSGDGQGLADRTQRRFFSAGTLPDDVSIDAQSTPAEVMASARRSLKWSEPVLGHLDVRDLGVKHYVRHEGQRVLAYQREAGQVHFFLDSAVYEDTAQSWLPQIGAYSVGLLKHLFRGTLTLTATAEGVTATVEGLKAGSGRLRWFTEDQTGMRHEVGQSDVHFAATASPVGSRPVPATRDKRMVAVLRGQDEAGDFVASGELTLPVSRPQAAGANAAPPTADQKP